MSIEVKVYSGKSKEERIKKAPVKPAKILTNAYVRQLSQGISYRIAQREDEQSVAKRALTNKFFR